MNTNQITTKENAERQAFIPGALQSLDSNLSDLFSVIGEIENVLCLAPPPPKCKEVEPEATCTKIYERAAMITRSSELVQECRDRLQDILSNLRDL